MSILSLHHFSHLADVFGRLADVKDRHAPGFLDRLLAALTRARMAQAERLVAQFCPIAFDRSRRPDAAACRPFRIE